MPKGLPRRQGGGERHFITCSCYHRMQFLGSARRRDVFLKILEEVRRKFLADNSQIPMLRDGRVHSAVIPTGEIGDAYL